MTLIFDFATFLAKEIHNGVIRKDKGVMDKPFCWCSILMYVYLYKVSSLIRKEMKLVMKSEGRDASATVEC